MIIKCCPTGLISLESTFSIDYFIDGWNAFKMCSFSICLFLHQALSEAYRVLAPGGRFLCLEFSEVQNKLIARYYSVVVLNYMRLSQSI